MIGDDIVITVVEIRGDKVRLGIEAPTAIQVHREEVWNAIQLQNIPVQEPLPAPNDCTPKPSMG
jgi:carbon storage regulator